MQVITHRKHTVNLSNTERGISIIAGGALSVLGLKHRSPAGFALALIGADLIRRGATGHSYLYEWGGVRTAPKGQGAETTSVPYELGVKVEHSITVGKPRAEVYRFWRDLENLPRFMKHLRSVTVLDSSRSHWRAEAPAGRTVEWDAEIHNEVENELIAWRSLPGADVDNAGSVRFQDAPGGRGTEVRVELQYNPPGGVFGALAAKLWGEEPSQQIQEDLRRLKQILEVGEIPTTEGQPRGGERVERASRAERRRDAVQGASEDSFPASDAPAWSH